MSLTCIPPSCPGPVAAHGAADPRGGRPGAAVRGSRRRDGAFSLIELLVAVSILVILSTVVGVRLMQAPGKARVAAARTQIERFRLGLQMYVNDNGFLPTERQGLQALVEKPSVPPLPPHYPAAGGYLDASRLPLDPWGHPYDYRLPGRRGEPFEIISYGADGQPGGEGDSAEISSSDF